MLQEAEVPLEYRKIAMRMYCSASPVMTTSSTNCK
jgi:hypothetical protein